MHHVGDGLSLTHPYIINRYTGVPEATYTYRCTCGMHIYLHYEILHNDHVFYYGSYTSPQETRAPLRCYKRICEYAQDLEPRCGFRTTYSNIMASFRRLI
jgi:hypothetical protein